MFTASTARMRLARCAVRVSMLSPRYESRRANRSDGGRSALRGVRAFTPDFGLPGCEADLAWSARVVETTALSERLPVETMSRALTAIMKRAAVMDAFHGGPHSPGGRR